MQLKKAEKQDWKQIKELYKSAFPRDERAPYFLLKKRVKQGKGDVLVAKAESAAGEEFVGFVYVVTYRDLAYLFYFAVDGAKRGSGNGSRILQMLKEKYAGKRIFLAREQLDSAADNYAQRVSRHKFYLKNGFLDLPLQIKEADVVYDVMGIGGAVTPEEYGTLMGCWCGPVFRRMIPMRLMEKEE